MNEQFEYGEDVQVSNTNFKLWCQWYYVATAHGNDSPYITVQFKESVQNMKEGVPMSVVPFKQIRKIQPTKWNYYNYLEKHSFWGAYSPRSVEMSITL